MTEVGVGDALTWHLPADAHPWLADFVADPDVAFDSLIRGYADLREFVRADVPDAAVQIFGVFKNEHGFDSEHPVVKMLSRSIVAWFDEARRRALSNDIGRRRRQIGQLCDLFDIISRLKLPDAAESFYKDRVRITHRLTAFREGDDRDAQLSFFTMLANMQPALTDRGIDVAPLVPLWHELCANAGGGLPNSYLDAGLLGLRRYPNPSNVSDVSGWLAGLVRWGLSQPVTERDFMRKWTALKFLYPRSPERWKQPVEQLFKQNSIREALDNADADLFKWLTKEHELKSLNLAKMKNKPGLNYPSIDDFNKIELGIKNDLKNTLEKRLPFFAQEHIRFAQFTGIVKFLDIAFHRVGKLLVETRDQDAARQAIELALEAMRWLPSSSHSWALWADALEVLGQKRSSEMVRREQLRRLPFHVDAVTQLAEFLIADGRPAEALELIQSAELIGIANEVVLAIKVRIVSNLSGIAEAKTVLAAALKSFPDHEALHTYQEVLHKGHVPKLPSGHYQRFPLAVHAAPQNEDDFELKMAKLSQQSMILAHSPDNAEARNYVEKAIADDPELVLAKIIAARHGFWSTGNNAMPGFAVAFELALNSRDVAALETLAQTMPRFEALTLIARAIFGDKAAAEQAESWLRNAGSSDHFDQFRQWVAERWSEDRLQAPGNVLSFADFVAKRKDLLLAGTRLAHEGSATTTLLAA